MRFAALFIILLAGCAENASNDPRDFGGPASDMGAASFDLGFFPSDASMLNDANLTAPLAWVSLVPLDTQFLFDVNLPKAPSELEGYFSIVQRPNMSPLAGAFSWKGSSGVYKLTFIPSAKLADGADFEVQITLPGKPKVGISTGSHPRVRRAKLSHSGASDMTMLVSFSEPMKESTFLGKLVASYDNPQKAITFTNFTKVDATTYSFTIPNGQTLAHPITLTLKPGIQAMTGTALDPKSWDSATEAMGSFEWNFFGADEFVPELQ
jgi:hypothetical protein